MKNLSSKILKSVKKLLKSDKYIFLFLLVFAVVFNFKSKLKVDRVTSLSGTKTKTKSPTPKIIKEVNTIKVLSSSANPMTKLIRLVEEKEADATGTDSAMYQNYKMTSDPALGYPPYERMRTVRGLIDNNQSSGNKAIQGMNWYERGSNSCSGRTRAIMWDPLDPTHKKVWAGGVNGGLWYTDDITLDPPSFGNQPPSLQWNNVTDIWSNLAINCIAFDNVSGPPNAKYYVGTGEGFIATTQTPTGTIAPIGGGIWESSDGVNWNVIQNTVPGGPNTMFNFNYIQKISFLAGSNPNISDMYVGTFNNGILKRDISGLWSKVLGQGPGFIAQSNQVADLEPGYGITYKLYAAMGLSATDGIYGYNQSLNTWVNLCQGNGFPTNFKRICLATDPLSPNSLYALVQTTAVQDIKLYKSINEGGNWTNIPFGAINPGTSQSGYCMSFGVSPGGNVIYAGGVGQVISNDGGSTWVQLQTGNGFHVDQHDIQFQANEAILCNDGGIYYSSDASMSSGGVSIIHKSEGYNVSQLYSCAIKNVANDTYYIFGAQDNGVQISDGSNTIISNTIRKIYGDGGFCFVDQDQPNIQIASHQGNIGFKYSTSSGNNFAPFNYSSSMNNYFTNCGFIVPCDYDSRENIFFQQHTETSAQGTTDDCGDLRLLKFSNVAGGGPNQSIGFNHRNKVDLIIPSTFKLNMTAFKVLPINPQPNVSTVFFGTDNGKLYKVPNIPNNGQDLTINAVSLNSPLAGQNVSVSSIEIGTNEDQILVTFSNFGISSVWETKDGGLTWEDKDAPTQPNPSLPDMPIYWAIYNPNNTNEVLLATEAGIWSTDNINELPYPIWGFNTASNCPKTSFRMLKHRTADNLVVAASHGRGLWASEVFKHPVASFTVTQSQPCPGLAVNFTNTSTLNPTSYLWDFGDGNTSTAVSPFHFYIVPGTYTCKLTVNNSYGTSTFSQVVNATLTCCTGVVDILDGKKASHYINDLNGPITTFLVKGKFYFDVNGLSLNGKDFIAEPGAEIIVEDGIAFYATNCNFYACSDMWQGISVRNESKLVLENCVIKDANTGVAPNFRQVLL
ncbi:MAG: PKD domain-containing protein [Bacteroidetes bacterium]|nr:PKD domain-containing protein [Bacteroidota bacterium]